MQSEVYDGMQNLMDAIKELHGCHSESLCLNAVPYDIKYSLDQWDYVKGVIFYPPNYPSVRCPKLAFSI